MEICLEDYRAFILALTLYLEEESVSRKSLNFRNPKLDFKNFYIECDYFCRQCEDYFDTIGTNKYERVSITVLFLKEQILYK